MRTNHTTLIICEGEKTEPLFFKSLLDYIEKEKKELDTIVTLRPEPPEEEDEEVKPKPQKHKPPRKTRKTHKVEKIDKEQKKKTEGYPLNWVMEGKAELNDETFDEVWVVFDHDNHPKRKEAFDEADIKVNEKKVQIAFSSRSFEYYLLVHFEKIYRTFEKTDCKFDENVGKGRKKRSKDQRNTKFVRCSTSPSKYPELDCYGKICLNGYAHAKGYWNNSDDENSKDKKDFFQEIEGKLELGYENAAWVRYMSEQHQGTEPIYERNPYLTTDNIVKRLLLNREKHVWINAFSNQSIDGLKIWIVSNHLYIRNETNVSIVLSSITAIYRTDEKTFGNQQIIFPTKDVKFDISEYLKTNVEYFKIKYGKYNIMISL